MISFLLLLTIQINHISLCKEIYKDLTGVEGQKENYFVCSLLIEDAIKQNIDLSIVLSTAWEESRFTQQAKPTKYNCIGPMQIKYRYWCPNKKGKISITKGDGHLSMCDPYFHGVRALKYYVNKFKPLKKALCFYNNSRKCKKTYMSDYVKRVFKFKTKINAVIEKRIFKSLKSLKCNIDKKNYTILYGGIKCYLTQIKNIFTT